eukprot:TRINITY_DN114054_c0_g1_i1.p1 TRINITY_DN114054_c0_g1~~TRINITY_DN114054_c0_g1_i1.p1  ORF type:complete len:322 (-),score=-3.34 TRINITY_DN114054_c0_g1_i1:111-1076(-)
MNLIILFLASLSFSVVSSRRLTEPERVAQWRKKHTWPPTWQVESEGYKKLMEEREQEILTEIVESNERWENMLQYVQSRYVKPFTELGFKLTKVPQHINEELQKYLQEGLENWDNLRMEGEIPVIHGPPSKMIDMSKSLKRIHKELMPLHEEWAGGIKLKPTSIYGMRLYRNGSSLSMHCDKGHTHVISSIIHVNHEYDNDNEPWPIEIEGHDGKLYQVNLEPGDMLFYESAKSLHGRRAMFKGKYYAGVFAHYQPVDKKVWSITTDEVINAIPPHWNEGVIHVPGAPLAGAAITVPSRRCENAPPIIKTIDHFQKHNEEF